MKRRWTIPSPLIAGAVLFLFGPSPDSALPQDYTIRSDVRLVLLDVSVEDRQSGLVSGLSKKNFTVLENGRAQPITVFSHDDAPVTVGIVVDESMSMTPKRSDVLAAAETFIGASNPRDEIFVLNFNNNVTRGLPDGTLFSDNIGQLSAALQRGLPAGKTALYDAVVAGLQQLDLGKKDKKTLVVISDGGDNASVHTRREMLDMVDQGVATIYAIGLYDAADPDRDPGILRQLARASGGAAYFPSDKSEMVPLCQAIAKDIRSRYTIGYTPEPGTSANALRHIRVLASAPGHGRLIARTRTSYRYAETPSSSNR
ncbi:MAG TPA: VWA domain-containing protein [Candidatus Sulfopaludibacter sp.]|nr:VWA domain-containing protein [Candidatus Sulfopaludibacter sp.]